MQLRDPRSHRTYRTAALGYIASAPPVVTCALCGQPLNTTLPGSHDLGPTIEHQMPIRVILARASSNAEALQLACDQTAWSLAHRRCQSRQGGHAATQAAKAPKYTPSRDW